MLKKFVRKIQPVSNLSAVTSRFPIITLALIIFAGIIGYSGGTFSEDGLGRLLIGLAIGMYICVILTVKAEVRSHKPLWYVHVVIIIICAIIGWFSHDMRLNLLMALGAVLLCLGNSVPWRRSENNLRVWDFTHKIWTGAAFSTLGAILFTLGITAISFALESLFGILTDALSEHVLFPVGLAFLAPLYWLSSIPSIEEDLSELTDNPSFVSKAVAFMGTWILAPLTLIYALILVAYGAKITLSLSLPSGEIAGLTVPFLLIGTLTWLFLEPPFIQKHNIVKLFRKIWFPVTIPVAIMLAIAIFIRVSVYGMTPQRIALIACVIWALAIGIIFTFDRQKKLGIGFIPGFGAALLVVGAITSNWISISSQSSIFKHNIVKAGVLTNDGHIVSDIIDFDIPSARRAKGALEYLFYENGRSEITKTLAKASVNLDDYEALISSLNLKAVSVFSHTNSDEFVAYYRKELPINVSEFDFISDIQHYWGARTDQQTVYEQGDVRVTLEKGIINVSIQDVGVKRFNFDTWLSSLSINGEEYPTMIEPFHIFREGEKSIAILPTVIVSENNAEGKGAVYHNEVQYYILTSGLN